MNPNDQQGYYRPDQAQPGVTPTPQPQPPAVAASAAPAPPVQPAVAQAAPVAPQQAPAEPPVAEQEPEDDEDQDDDRPVTWMAYEYIHQEKGATWFAIFAVILLAFLALSIFLMKSWSFAALLVVIAVVVVVYSRRPPRQLAYSLDSDGLTIDNKLHKFSDFKSFGVVRDGEEFSVMLIPTQRFQPGITVYFPEEAGEDIVDMLGARLPMKDLRLDAVDRLVRLLRL